MRGDEEAIAMAARYLLSGKIVAVKGLGGYHLACDATECGGCFRAAREKIPQREAIRFDGEEY